MNDNEQCPICLNHFVPEYEGGPFCEGHANRAKNQRKRARELARIKAGTATPSMVAQHSHRHRKSFGV